ncbi:unnamed protein product [Penicillium pancosmium]
MISNTELFKDWLALKLDHTLAARSCGFTAWAGGFMNTWNSNFVKSGYQAHSKGFITNVDGRVELQHPMVAGVLRANQTDETITSEALRTAKEYYLANRNSIPFPYSQPTFGYVVKWLSELGKTTELDGLLKYADEQGNWTHMDPFSGNAAIGYAGLNVPDGQKKMWERPWTGDNIAKIPWVDGLDFSSGVDCLRGTWDEASQALIITSLEWSGESARVQFTAKTLPGGGEMKVSAIFEAHEEVDFVIVEAEA